MQRGCKLAKWSAEHGSGVPRETSNEVEIFEEILPHGIDAEGNEVSLEKYLTSHLYDNEETWRFIEEVRCGEHELDVEAYLSWYKFNCGDAGHLGKIQSVPGSTLLDLTASNTVDTMETRSLSRR